MRSVMVNVSRVIMSRYEKGSHLFVMLAKAGIQEFYIWIPASAGMTDNGLFRLFTRPSNLGFGICDLNHSRYAEVSL